MTFEDRVLHNVLVFLAAVPEYVKEAILFFAWFATNVMV